MRRMIMDEYKFQQQKCALETCQTMTSWREGYLTITAQVCCCKEHKHAVDGAELARRATPAREPAKE